MTVPTSKTGGVIELVGAMGCGKSTLFREIYKQACQHENLKRYLMPRKAFGISFMKPGRTGFTTSMSSETGPGSGSGIEVEYSEKDVKRISDKALGADGAETVWDDFILTVIFGRKGYHGTGERALRRMEFFCKTVRKVAMANFLADRKGAAFLLDEGLFQRALSMSFHFSGQKEMLIDYFGRIPIQPSLLIHVRTDHDTVMERLRKRPRSIDQQNLLGDVVLQVDCLAALAREKGIPVIELDGAVEPAENARNCFPAILDGMK